MRNGIQRGAELRETKGSDIQNYITISVMDRESLQLKPVQIMHRKENR